MKYCFDAKKIVIYLLAIPKGWLILLFFVCGFLNTSVCFAIEANFQNEILPASSFENLSNWEISTIDYQKFDVNIDTDNTYLGKPSICIYNDAPNSVVLRKKIFVDPDSCYKISCRIKTKLTYDYYKVGVGIWINNLQNVERRSVVVNDDWRYSEIYIKSGHEAKYFYLNAGLEDKGNAWFSDFKIEKPDNIPFGISAIDLDSAPHSWDAIGFGKWHVVLIFSLIIFYQILWALIPKKFKAKFTDTLGLLNNDAKNSTTHVAETPQVTGSVGLINNEAESSRLSKADYIIICVLISVFSALVIFNLGSFSVPLSSWTSRSQGESVTIDLGREVTLSKIYFYCGLGNDKFTEFAYNDSFYKYDYFSKNYNVMYKSYDGEYHKLLNCTFYFWDLFKWRYFNVEQVKTNSIKIICMTPGSELKEIGIFELGSVAPVKISKISLNDSREDTGRAQNIIDEQEKIVYTPTKYYNSYFDEVYYGRSGYEILSGLLPIERTHPPLGKIIISLGIYIFGMNPFGWRIIDALLGIASVLLMFLLGKKIFKNRFYAFCASYLIMFETMHFVQSRLSSVDVFVMFFSLIAYYFIYDIVFEDSPKGIFRSILFSGIFLGFGIACKWISAYTAAGIVLLVILTSLRNANRHKFFKWAGYGILAYVLIPIIIYFVSFIPIDRAVGASDYINHPIQCSVEMFKYHLGANSENPQRSYFWEWPFNRKPLTYDYRYDYENSLNRGVICVGNYAVFWVGTLCLIFCLYIFLRRKRNKDLAVILSAFLFQYIPWVFVTRGTFIYHYYSCVPYVILMIVYCIRYVLEKYPHKSEYVFTYLRAVFLMFVVMYPFVS